MDILGAPTITQGHVEFFLAGVAFGGALLAVLSAMSPPRKEEHESGLSRRVGQMEMRLAAARQRSAIISAIGHVQHGLPGIGRQSMATQFAASSPGALEAADVDPEALAQEFIQTLRDNAAAASGIARAIVDPDVNLNDPADRRDVAQQIRSLAATLDAGFWDRHAGLILASALSGRLKELLQTFFAQVGRLKQSVATLPKSPAFADLDTLLDHALAVIDTTVAIIDELNAHAGP